MIWRNTRNRIKLHGSTMHMIFERYACEVADAANTHIDYMVGDVMSIDMSVYGGYFDIVFMEGGILHYFYNINEFMGVMNNLLKDGGKMICSDFHPIRKFTDIMGLGNQVTDYFTADILERGVFL